VGGVEVNRRVALVALAGLAVLAAPRRAGGQATSAWSYFANFRSVEGLALDGDFLWGATSSGVFRFNKRTRGANDYVFYSAFDGMAANPTAAVVIDGRGNKWFAHTEVDVGLSVLDSAGVNWRIIEPQDGLLLRSGKKATTLLATGDSVWAGTESGVTLFVDGITRLRLDTDDGLPSEKVQAIARSGRYIWIGTDAGLSRLDGGSLTNYTTAQGLAHNEVFSLATHPTRSEVWVGTHSGVSIVFGAGDSIRTLTTQGLDAASTGPSFGILEIAFDEEGVAWVGLNKGPGRWLGTRWQMEIRTPNDGTLGAAREVGAFAIGGREFWGGFITLGTSAPSGIASLSFISGSGLWTRAGLGRSPYSNFFGSLDLDASGNVWTTSARKRDGKRPQEPWELVRFNGTNQFRDFNETNAGFTRTNPDIVAIDADDRKWIGFWDIFGGLNRLSLSGSSVDTFNIDVVCEAVANGQEACTGIRFDAKRNVWAAWEFFGITAYDPVNERCATWGKEQGIPAAADGRPTPNALALDQRGRVWVGFARGSGYGLMLDPGDSVFSQSDDIIERFDPANSEIPNEFVHCVEVDSLGRVWFGTEGGLAIHTPGSGPGSPDSAWIKYTASAGSNLLNESIRSIAFLPDRSALIGDNAGNVYTLGSDLVTWGPTYNLKTVGFPNRSVSQIKYDAGRRVIWFALYGGGLVRYDPAQVPPPINPEDPIHVLVYPNPWLFAREGSEEVVTFDQVRSGASVWVYTLTGEFVRSLAIPEDDDTVGWDLRNSDGAEVASGVYLFVVRKNGADIEHGKVAIIR